jgi:hypothetical protein
LCLSVLSCKVEGPGNNNNDGADPLFETVPSIANCTSGVLSEAEQQKILNYINNSVRATHSLPAVVYDTKKDRVAQDAALIGAANATITAAIVEADLCYSQNGAQECSRGNRSLWGSATSKWPTSEIHVNDWMTELNTENINDRRRILDPFLKQISFGRVIGTPKKGDFKYVSSAVLVTVHDGDANISETDMPEYIAYPKGVCEVNLFDANSFLSFSVLYNKDAKANNGESMIDFSEATVEVSVGSQALDIIEGSLSYDYDNYGLPNNLQWKVQGLAKNVTYNVKVMNVIVAGETKDYEYTFSFK